MPPARLNESMSPGRKPGDGSAAGIRARGGRADRLGLSLAHEDPETTSVEVARTWHRAYSELVDFEEKVLGRLQDLLPTLGPAARQEAELTNLPMIVDHLKMFRYRRAHWRERLQELDGH